MTVMVNLWPLFSSVFVHLLFSSVCSSSIVLVSIFINMGFIMLSNTKLLVLVVGGGGRQSSLQGVGLGVRVRMHMDIHFPKP